MEKNLRLKTSDGHIIHATLNTSARTNKTLVIFVHGLTGHQNEHNFHTAAGQFPKKGVDVLRFSLYTGEKGGRKLSECTIQTHAEDLNIVTKHFRKKYKTIAVVGHSLGSPTILKSDKSGFDVVVLWDPSYLARGSEDLPKKAKLRGKEVYIEEWGTEYLMNPAMVKEWKKFNGENELGLIENLEKPLKIIAAGKGILVKGSKAYFKSAQEPKDLVVISGATHCFDEIEKEEELLKETLSWVKKHTLK
tara:strand:- start:6132 stop:6875 length:744 start_codon:yes stop_codon:yes gene_type:complete